MPPMPPAWRGTQWMGDQDQLTWPRQLPRQADCPTGPIKQPGDQTAISGELSRA
jgi:hypothetical protein